jgi:lysophospholipase L1-like esterase
MDRRISRLCSAALIAGLTHASVATAQPSGTSNPLSVGKAPVSSGNTTASSAPNDCTVKAPVFEGRGALRSVTKAIKEKRPVRVIAIGSSSTVGVGASSPLATYPTRLEKDLEGYVAGMQVEMYVRGINGEIAEDAADRLKMAVADIKPDLVIWQVGTNDALARVEEDDFASQLRSTLQWLASHKIDVVLIDPQYVERLSKDGYYKGIVDTIAEVAQERHVLLVNRYDAMADLARQHPGLTYLAGDKFHLNDLGYKCMAEYAARAIVAGITQAGTTQAGAVQAGATRAGAEAPSPSTP